MKVRELVVLAFLTAILLVAQVGMAFLPNIELVSLLIIVYTLVYKKKVFYIIYGFVILEGIVYGFGIWWWTYLYIWTILAMLVLLFQKNESTLLWAVISGSFGLGFGILCSVPYFITGGWAGGWAYWFSGIPFDILHCIGNGLVALVLYRPVYRAIRQLEQKTMVGA